METFTCDSEVNISPLTTQSDIVSYRFWLAEKDIRDDCITRFTRFGNYNNRSIFLQMFKHRHPHLRSSEAAMRLFFTTRKSPGHIPSSFEKRILNFATRAWMVLFQNQVYQAQSILQSSSNNQQSLISVSSDNDMKNSSHSHTKSVIVQIAYENIEKAKSQLRTLGHTVPFHTTPELRALEEEILIHRPVEAQNQLRSILPQVSEAELNLMHAEMRAQMYEMYLNCYISWKTTGINLALSNRRTRKDESNSIAPAA